MDTNWNNGFGVDGQKLRENQLFFNEIQPKSWQNSTKSGTKIKIMDLGWDLIFDNEIGQYLTENQWKLNEIPRKLQWKMS